MQGESKKYTGRIRLIILSLILVAIFVFAVMRLMTYQIVQGNDYAVQAENNLHTKVAVEAARGDITDRYGRPLVVNKLALNLQLNRTTLPKGQENQVILDITNILQEAGEEWIDTFPITKTEPYQFLDGADQDIKKLKKTLKMQDYATATDCMNGLIKDCNIDGYNQEETRRIAGIRAQMLMKEFGVNNPYTIAEDVSNTITTKIMEMGNYIPGVSVSESSVREYISGTIAPHLIGTTGPIYAEEYEALKDKDEGYKQDEYIGKSGIEKQMQDSLRGINGEDVVVKNKQGGIVDQYTKTPAEPGNTVMLTIDKKLQQDVQTILQNFILDLRSQTKYTAAKGGSVAVLDVKTGEALALATYPSYDINEYKTNFSTLAADKVMTPLNNRVIQGLYRPGSTFKTIMTVAGVSEGIITPGFTVNCNGNYPFFGADYGCLRTRHSGAINVNTALQWSCNIFFYETAYQLGDEAITNYAHLMGLAADTGLEIPNAKGYIASKSLFEQKKWKWEAGFLVQTGIGQSETMVTPLQMALGALTIANKGVRYESHLVKSIEKYDYSGTVSKTEPVIAHELPDTANAFEIVTDGMKSMASTISNLNGYNVAAKSGTPENGSTYNSAVVAFYPADNPEIAISVMLEEGENAKDMLKPIIDAYNATKTQEDHKRQPKEQMMIK